VIGWSPPGEGSDSWRFETESDWPPADVSGGSVEATDERGSCASGGRTLVLTPTGTGEATFTVELPVPRSTSPPDRRSWLVTPRVFERGSGGHGTMALIDRPGGEPLLHWEWTDNARAPSCMELSPSTIELGGDRLHTWLVVTAHGGSIAVDRTVLRGR
jgi:hypothetical protein